MCQGVSPPSSSSSSSLPFSDEVRRTDDGKDHRDPRRTAFYQSFTDEPHASRRKEILAKYPEIKALYGHDPKTKYVTMALVIVQVFLAAHVSSFSWSKFFLTAYVVGGTCNHMLMLAMHELSHNLGFRKMMHNRIFGLFANLPVGVPSAISFKRYHMEHHRYQGEDGIDVDIPTVAEGHFFQSRLAKLFFIVFQVFFYAFRPLVVNPKKPTLWEYMNMVTAFSFDFIVYRLWGPSALMYLLLSTVLGSGLHPVAGHFISEHYVFVKGAETYSYYGILNILTFNVGYHNEHHDFPFIPGSRLPQVRAIAPEYYNSLPKCKSWVKVLYDYIMDPSVGAFSRIKRQRLDKKEIEHLKSQ